MRNAESILGDYCYLSFVDFSLGSSIIFLKQVKEEDCTEGSQV